MMLCAGGRAGIYAGTIKYKVEDFRKVCVALCEEPDIRGNWNFIRIQVDPFNFDI